MSASDTGVTSVRPARQAAERLRITEIFHSIQGEADAIGWRTVFVRLTGCPLRCVWCDTEYSFHGGDWHAIDDILAEVARHGARHVCVTGGEPLAQKRCLLLLARLCDGVVEKIRHYVAHANHEFEVDEFFGANDGLVVAELELDSVDEAYERPDWLGAEVSELTRYYNLNLIAYPYSAWTAQEREGRD